MERRARITRAGTAERCAYCRGGLLGRDARECAGCGTWLHGDCLTELGSCPTLGCGAAEPMKVRGWPPYFVTTLAAHPLGHLLGYGSGLSGTATDLGVWTSDGALTLAFLALSGLIMSGRRGPGPVSEQAMLLLFWFGYALGWTSAHGLLWRPQLRTVILAWLITAGLAVARRVVRRHRAGREAR